MNQTIAKIFGWVLILVGIAGFFSGSMNMMHGEELGLLPVNIVHNIVHILIGLWGLNAARTLDGATAYCKQAGVLFLLLGILGMIPAVVEMFATIVPLGGHAFLLHLVLGLVLGSFGFIRGSRPAAA